MVNKNPLSSLLLRFAQRTKLDYAIAPKNPGRDQSGRGAQQELKIIDPEMEKWRNTAFPNQWDMSKAKPNILDHREPSVLDDPPYGPDRHYVRPTNMGEIARQQIEENKRTPINIHYPALTPEQIKFRKLNEPETKNLLEEEQKEMSNKWRNPSKPPHTQQYFDLNKVLPEKAKERVISSYNSFRAIAAVFKRNYEEANDLAAEDNSFDFDSGTYADVFKRLPNLIIRGTRRSIGSLFGNSEMSKGKASYYVSDSAKLIEFLNKGINIFNITPLNLESKISELQVAGQAMMRINESYLKRKKFLTQLPPIVNEACKSYLRKPDVRDFFKWLDRYFQTEKKSFFEDCVEEILNTNENRNSWKFQIGQLTKFKTYSEMFGNSKNRMGHDLMWSMEEKVKYRSVDALIEMTKENLDKKLAELVEISDPKILQQYVLRHFGFDIRSAFQVQEMLFKNETPEVRVEKMTTIREEFFNELRKEMNRVSNSPTILKNAVIQFMDNALDGRRKKRMDNARVLESLQGQATVNSITVSIMRDAIVNSLPQMSRGNYNDGKLTGVGSFLRSTGRFTPESVAQHMSTAFPFIPKEFWLHLAKATIRKIGDNPSIRERITNYSGDNANAVINTMYDAAKSKTVFGMMVIWGAFTKTGKASVDSFTDLFVSGKFRSISHSLDRIASDLKEINQGELAQALISTIRSRDTLSDDVEKFQKFANYIHNSAKGLTVKDIAAMVSNPNYRNYDSVGIAKKLLNINANLRAAGGFAGIRKKFGETIDTMQKEGMVSKDFERNIRLILSTVNGGSAANPSMPGFDKLFKAIATVETDLQSIEMSEALTELIKNHKPKDKRLFDLDYSISPMLRFRVLQDKDPRALRIGIETNCCQRIGGVGEAAAEQSFINPLAGVVILEQSVVGNWELLTQSYFHYVPKDNGFILDNVESNSANVSKSGVDLSAAYALLAAKIKEKFDISYFVAGKGYSKLPVRNFKTHKMRGPDPRYFSPEAGKYSDYSANDSINLLDPKFNLEKATEELTGTNETVARAFGRNLNRIIKTAMR